MVDYWMRWVDFTKLARLLLLVIESPGRLSPTELDRAAIASGTFVSSSGKPFGPTTRYHYRRILEKLEMVRKGDGRFISNLTPYESSKMVSDYNADVLNDDQCQIFGDRVIRNHDCYDALWKAFVPFERPHALQDFICRGQPVILETTPAGDGSRDLRRVTVSNPENPGCSIVHEGYKAIEAIHFGMRAWGISQLRFLDELYRVGEGYHIFPVNIGYNINATTIQFALVEALDFRADWAMPRVSDLLLDVASRLRVPLAAVRCALEDWLLVYPGYVSPVPISYRMILSGHSTQLKKLILAGFLALPGGQYVSHLRVHSGLAGLLAQHLDAEVDNEP